MGATLVGTGTVQADGDPAKQGKILARAALEDGGMEAADFGLLFCSAEFDLDPFITGLDAELGDTKWIGCTTAGEITPDGPAKGQAVLLLVSSDEMDLWTTAIDGIHDDPTGAGHSLIEDLPTRFWEDDREGLLLTLLAGQTQRVRDVSFDVLGGMIEAADESLPVVGGAAGDDLRLQQTYQFRNGEIYEDGVVLGALRSRLPIRTGQAHGLEETIATGVITAADGNVINEISGEPAASFYADAIDVDQDALSKPLFASDLPVGRQIAVYLRYLYHRLRGQDAMEVQRIFEHALSHAMAIQQGTGEYRVVTPLEVQEDGSVLMSSRLKENQAIHVLEGGKDDVIEAGKTAFSDIDTSNTVFGVVIDCVTRNILLDDQEREKEIEKMLEGLGCPTIGFYGHGEIGGPSGGLTTVKNQTVSGFVVTED